MMMKNKMIRALGLSIVAVGLTMGQASAATSVTASASATVLSTITIVETTALTFGSVAAFADDTALSTDIATLTMPADGSATSVAYSATSAEANIVEIITGNPAVFDITGAAPNTVITITLPSTDQALTDPAGGPNAFVVNGFTKAIISSGTAFTYDTDATGALSFGVGADLVTEDSTHAGFTSTAKLEAYADSTYTGTYTVTVSY